MTNEEFKSLLLQAGFKSKKEFAEFIGLHYMTAIKWGKENPYPSWLKIMLQWAKKARKYDELVLALAEKNEKV